MAVKSKNHFKAWKKGEFEKVSTFLKTNEMIAVADISGLPASALREFRKVLKDKGFSVKVSKVKIIRKVLAELKMKELDADIRGNVAIIGGKGSPYAMYSTIKKNASSSGAKVGMIAPMDIVVPMGDTGIAPGPALSDFKAVKIDTQIRNGHIFVPKDTVVAKKDSVIDAKVVSILAKLNIKPMKILMKIKSAFDKVENILFSGASLDINIDQYKSEIINAYLNAYNLAISQAYVTKQTIKPLVKKAYRNSKAVALSQNIVNKGTIKDILGKAHKVVSNVEGKINN